MSSVLKALVAALLGVASGIASAAMILSDKELLYAPGLVFGVAAVLLGGILWRPGYWRSALAIILITLAWPLAHYLSVISFGPIGKALGGQDEINAMRLALQVGNAVGGVLTIAAMSIMARCRPGPVTIVPTLLVGALAAFLAVVAKADGVHGDILPDVLMPGWQAGVLFFIVLGLNWRRQDQVAG